MPEVLRGRTRFEIQIGCNDCKISQHFSELMPTDCARQVRYGFAIARAEWLKGCICQAYLDKAYHVSYWSRRPTQSRMAKANVVTRTKDGLARWCLLTC